MDAQMQSGNGPAEQAQDERWMGQALALATASIGFASPNPRVGCVLVREGAAVGQGAHHYAQKDHAEVVALREAGPLARGATAYVTLEPCSHYGRTPPCAEALLAAGVGRVVVATEDPNPQVRGAGIRLLRSQGIPVTTGVLAERARALNDGFARSITSGLPFVLLKAALSLDGRIAPPAAARMPGRVAYLTGERSLSTVHTIRHSVDAVLTGVGTVLQDDPLLTDRSGKPRRRRLLRVVLDSTLRMPATSRLAGSADGDVLILTTALLDEAPDPAKEQRRLRLEEAGLGVETVAPGPDGRLDLTAALQLLARRYGVLNVLAEGGSHLNQSLLQSSTGEPIADKLCLFYAPVCFGEAGVPFLSGPPLSPLHLSRLSVHPSGPDVCLKAYLRDPWTTLPSGSMA